MAGIIPFADSFKNMWFEKESLINYELGLKSNISKNFILSTSLYYMDIKDKQVLVEVIPGITANIQNAAQSTSKGIEIDSKYLLNDELQFFASFAYNDTKFKKFSDAAGDYSGNKNPYSPKYTYVVGTNYRNDFGIFFNINYKVFTRYVYR